MNDVDYDEQKFERDKYGNLWPREDQEDQEKKQEMIKFKDLVFSKHPNGFAETQAKVQFPNNYGASIIFGSGAYTNSNKPYEVTVLKNGKLCCDTEITDDIPGYQTEADVEKTLEQIQNLPKED